MTAAPAQPVLSRPVRPLYVVVTIFITLAAVSGLSLLTAPHDRIPWRSDFAAARAESARSGKPVMIYFTAKWCSACDELKRETWSDSSVANALSAYVPLKIDVDENRAVALRYAPDALPAYAVLDADGKPMRSVEGLLRPEEFIDWLHGTAASTQPVQN